MSTLIVCIVFEKETEECLAVWLKDEVVPALFTEVGATGNQNPILLYLPMEKDTLGELVSSRVAGTIQECTAQQNNGSFVCLLLSVFWDGTTEESKSVFSNLKKFSVSDSTEFQGLQSSLGDTKLEFLLQALNAKKGQHNMKNNETALINSLQGKVKKAALWANDGQATTSPSIKKESTGGSADGHLGMLDISPEALGAAASQAQGECFVVVASPTKEGLLERVTTLRDNAEKANLGVSAVLLDPREVVVSQEPKKTEWAQEFLLRKTCSGGGHIQMRLAMCGNVDSGKSTLTSVLTRGCRDDGRGFARAFVFNHKHESVTGRTSSISENHLGFTATGEVVNYQLGGATQSHTPATLRSFTPQELSSRSSKVLTLYDLAGHEKYLKTTVLGMTRNMPDYSCIVVSGNNGIQRMTKEHLALCLALKLPFFIVVTRIDSTPANVMKETLDNINKLMKIPTVKKLPYPITTHDEMILAAKNLKNDRIAPIFQVSNVTGDGVATLMRFLDLLPQRKDWTQARQMPRQMIIDSTFFVTGVGTVVGGIITQGVFHVNDTVLLGPDGLGHYRPVSIKSIHVKGVERPYAEAGNDAALCLKKEKRSGIRKGNILSDTAVTPVSFWQFEAEITILYHSTTISVNYEPVIHSATVRQSARITFVEREVLRTGDKSMVRFHFLYRPEFMHEGQRLIFREGRTKGIGIVTKLMTEPDNDFLSRLRSKNKNLPAS